MVIFAMSINLNNSTQFTLEDVRTLIAQKDDSQDRQLRVMNDGTAVLSDDVGAVNLIGVLFRFETWNAGNDYVGAKAAQDNVWVTRIFDALKKNWPIPTTTYIDSF